MREFKIDFNKALKPVLIIYIALFLVGTIMAVVFGVDLDINFSGGTKISYSSFSHCWCCRTDFWPGGTRLASSVRQSWYICRYPNRFCFCIYSFFIVLWIQGICKGQEDVGLFSRRNASSVVLRWSFRYTSAQ